MHTNPETFFLFMWVPVYMASLLFLRTRDIVLKKKRLRTFLYASAIVFTVVSIMLACVMTQAHRQTAIKGMDDVILLVIPVGIALYLARAFICDNCGAITYTSIKIKDPSIKRHCPQCNVVSEIK